MSNVTREGVSTETAENPWLLLVGMWTLGVSVTAFQIVPAGILPLIMDDLTIGPVAAGGLVSASLAAQALGNVPVGVVIDRTSNRLMLTIAAVGMVLAGVGAWQAALSGSYWPLVGAIVVGGVGIAAIITGGANLIGAAFDVERRATAVAAFTTCAPAGYAIGQFLGPVVADGYGWGANFLLFGGLAGVAFVGLAVIMTRVDAEPETGAQPSVSDFKRLFTNSSIWLVCLLSFLAYSLYLLFNSWMPTYISQQFGFSMAKSGLYAALFPAVGILARAGGGVISDRLFDRRRRPVSLMTFAVTVPLVVLVAAMRVPLFLVVLLLPAGFFVQLGIGLFYTYAREVVDEGVTGTALAMLGLISFAGAFTAPVVAGTLIQRTGGYLPAFAYAGALAVVGVVVTYFAPEPTTGGEANPDV
ncbi:MAG: nitrate/nitrite transporter [Salinigranum sp.]